MMYPELSIMREAMRAAATSSMHAWLAVRELRGTGAAAAARSACGAGPRGGGCMRDNPWRRAAALRSRSRGAAAVRPTALFCVGGAGVGAPASRQVYRSFGRCAAGARPDTPARAHSRLTSCPPTAAVLRVAAARQGPSAHLLRGLSSSGTDHRDEPEPDRRRRGLSLRPVIAAAAPIEPQRCGVAALARRGGAAGRWERVRAQREAGARTPVPVRCYAAGGAPRGGL